MPAADPVAVTTPFEGPGPVGTAESLQFKGLWKKTSRSSLFWPPPLHTTILALSIRTSPSSSTILRLIRTGPELSPASQVAPGASTVARWTDIFRVVLEPFPAEATLVSVVEFGLMFVT